MIAVIGILAALVFPGVRAARVSANRARTKVQFNQWAAAIEGFRSEYGFYPAFDVSGLVNGSAATLPGEEHLFHDLLAAARRDGSVPSAGSAATVQNRKRIRFHAFTQADFTPANSVTPWLLRDAFDNTAIAVLVDRDLDGVIKVGTDYAALPLVNGAAPGVDDFPASGIRAGVVFYAPAPESTPGNPAFILSWK